MKRAVLMLLMLASTSSASQYTFSNGYYWYNGVPYTRSTYWQPGTYCSPGYWYYSYARAYPAVTYNDVGWRSKLLDIAAARDKIEGDIRKGQFEQLYFMEAVRGLGLEGNFRIQGYGAMSPYALNYGANATTQYGYSYNTAVQVDYSKVDLNQLYQMAGQHTAFSQSAATQATTGFQGLVNQAGSQQARVQEVLAKQQFVEAVFRAIFPPTAETVQYKFSSSPAGAPVVDASAVPDTTRAAVLEKWKALAAGRCFKCHSGDKPKGNFDVTTYPQASQEVRDKTLKLLTSQDASVRMPKEGHALTPEELKLFILVK